MKPWNDIMISGFVMANKGEKLSKRKDNAKMEPFELLETYGADVVRYWAGSGKLGTDIIFNEETFLRGKKLINKIWNVSKFIEMHLQDFKDKKFDKYEYIDRWILGSFQEMEKGFIKYLDDYEIGLGLNHLERFFWNFCDNYIEIVKHRLYRPEEFGEEARYSGQKTVYMILYKLLQDFSIYFPFITEEIYQELYKDKKSIHITRGDVGIMNVTAKNQDGTDYTFQANDVIRFGVFQKGNMNNLIKQIDTSVSEPTTSVAVDLTSADTTIGDIINKPVNYWYEIQLNPDTNPQTIIGYDEEGAKLFIIYPEGVEE